MPGPTPAAARAGGVLLACVLATGLLLAACGGDPASAPSSTSQSADAAGAASAALGQAIKGIDAAVYAYGVVGAHLSGSAQRQAVRAMAVLSRQRAAFELATGAPVPEAAVAYQLPGPLTGAKSARSLASLLEMKLIALFDQVAAVTDGSTRALAIQASRKSAQRAQRWEPATAVSP